MPADMQKRPLILFFLVFLASLLVILLIHPWNPDRGGSRISLKDPKEVDRIVLTDPYNTTELNKREGRWYLFGTEELNKVAVENLLFAGSRLEAGSITDPETSEGAGESAGEGTGVAFFRGDRILLSFRISRQEGRFLLHPADSDRAFYVSLPGYPDLDLERVFSAAPDHYREHLLIDLRPSDIASIEVELASGEAFRFTQDQEGNVACKVANELTRMPDGAPNEPAIRRLFSYFTSIRYEQRTEIRADSIMENQEMYPWMATVQVHSFSGEHHSMQVFPYPPSPGSEPHLFKALVLYNQDQDALIINYIYLDVLMRDLSHYIGEK